MASSSVVIHNHSHRDTSSSCSGLEENLVNDQSKKKKKDSSSSRSRVKKRMNDVVLETKLTQLTNENEILRAKIELLQRKFGQEEQQPSVSNLLDRSSPAIEQSSMDKSSIPIKLRFKLLNITSDF